MKTLYTSAILALFAPAWCIAQPTPLSRQLDWWVASSTVRAIETDQDNGVAYLGGDFTIIQPPASTTYGCLLEATGEGWPVLRSPNPIPSIWFDHVRPNGIVRAVVSDGAGGWYIGGDFTQVNAQPRLRLAHILANGSLDPDWQSGTDGTIRTLALHNGKLYVGGDFSNASLVRNRIAAFHAIQGAPNYSNLVTEFNNQGQANNNQVRVIVASGNLLYVGGTFTSMGGATCNRLIALDASTGQSTSWAPNANGDVNAIALSGSTAMVGGSFSQMNSTARSRFAEIDLTTGSLTTFNPGANSTIWAVALSGDTLFAAGEFTSFFSQTRGRMAAVKLTPTPAILNWNPTADNAVFTMVVEPNSVRFGGNFGNAGTTQQVRYRIAEANRIDGNVTSWNPFADGTVLTLAKHSTGIYAGGSFTLMGYRLRNRLAAIDLATGKPTLFNPNVNGTVYDIELHEENIYIGGSFTSVGGLTRNRAAALDQSGTPLTLWQPNINNTVYALAKDGGTLYLGGTFTTISGYTRNRIAGLDLATGAVSTTWAPSSDGDVFTLHVNGGSLYAGGTFTTIGNPGQPRQRLARFALGNENPDTWNPGANGTVRTFAFKNNENKVFVGGQFTNIGGASRNYLAALDANSNAALAPWVCNANYFIYALQLSGNTLYVGGDFSGTTGLGGANRQGLGAVNATTGTVFPTWYESMNGSVQAIGRTGDLLLAGGAFSAYVTGTPAPRSRFAAWEVAYEDESTALLFTEEVNGSPVAFPNPTTGQFTIAADSPIKRIAVYNNTGQLVLEEGNAGNNRIVIDLGSEAAGLFTVRVFLGTAHSDMRVMLQR